MRKVSVEYLEQELWLVLPEVRNFTVIEAERSEAECGNAGGRGVLTTAVAAAVGGWLAEAGGGVTSETLLATDILSASSRRPVALIPSDLPVRPCTLFFLVVINVLVLFPRSMYIGLDLDPRRVNTISGVKIVDNGITQEISSLPSISSCTDGGTSVAEGWSAAASPC